MARLPRLGSAVSAVALAGLIAGCVAPMSRSGSAAKSANAKQALALRAQMALGAGDLVNAVDLAERAVENSPSDAAVRNLLGNAYFASGRFASAEAAYGDSLSLAAGQPQIALKLALVQIAQGKNGEALALLESGRGLIDAADYGLAVALAGQPHSAVEVLEVAARANGADARVRQNLALSYALSGNWEAARTIAAQDLSPDQVDARVQQWMALSKPARPSDQVASLVGVTPAASDPGQPVRLALNKSEQQLAAAARVEAPQPHFSVASPEVPPAPPAYVAAEPAPAFAEPDPVAVAAAESATAPIAAPQPGPEVKPAPLTFAAAAMMAPEAPAAFAALAPREVVAAPAPASKRKPAARKTARPLETGKSNAVVQLGAYGSPQRVALAWEQLVQRYPALRGYTPMRARFDGPRGTVWRLSIKGFDSEKEAIARCNQLRGRGGNCFVRPIAGDAPVQLASR